jgi:hypothetical protein
MPTGTPDDRVLIDKEGGRPAASLIFFCETLDLRGFLVDRPGVLIYIPPSLWTRSWCLRLVGCEKSPMIQVR